MTYFAFEIGEEGKGDSSTGEIVADDEVDDTSAAAVAFSGGAHEMDENRVGGIGELGGVGRDLGEDRLRDCGQTESVLRLGARREETRGNGGGRRGNAHFGSNWDCRIQRE